MFDCFFQFLYILLLSTDLLFSLLQKKNLSLSLLPNPLLEMFCQMDLSSSFIFIFSSWQILVPKSIKTQQPCCDLMLNKEDLLPDYPALKIESNIITMSPQLPRFKTKCTVCFWSIFLTRHIWIIFDEMTRTRKKSGWETKIRLKFQRGIYQSAYLLF